MAQATFLVLGLPTGPVMDRAYGDRRAGGPRGDHGARDVRRTGGL